MRDVGRLAKQRKVCVTDPSHERVVVSGRTRLRVSCSAQRIDKRDIGRTLHGLLLVWDVSPREQVANLFVRCLGEVVIPQPDRVEWLRRYGADAIVNLRPELFTGFRCGCCNRNDYASRLQLSQRLDGGKHGGPGCEAIIHQNHGAAANVGWRTTAAVETLAT